MDKKSAEEIANDQAREGKLNPQEVIFDDYVSRTWYVAKTATFYHRDKRTGNLLPIKKDDFRELMISYGFFDQISKPAAKKGITKKGKDKATASAVKTGWLNFLRVVRTTRAIDWVGELAGYPQGEHTVNGFKILVPKGPTLIQSVKGDPSFVLNFIHELLPETQADYFLTWLQDRLRGLLHPERYTPGQAMIIGGEVGDGKTLLKRRVIIPLLGGRGANAISYLIGEDDWNDDLAGREVWGIDDQGDTLHFNRNVYTNNVKAAIADPEIRIRTRYQSAITVPVKTALIILFNLKGRNFALLPEPLGDIRDKLIALKSSKATLPKDSEEIERRIAAALPATSYYLLNEYSPPAEVRTEERFRINAYWDPEIFKAVRETGHAAQLGELFQHFLETSAIPQWESSASRIYNTLLADSATRAQLEKICKALNNFGRLMAELAQQENSGVTVKRTHEGKTFVIKRVKNAASPEGENIVKFDTFEENSGQESRPSNRKKKVIKTSPSRSTSRSAGKNMPENSA